MFLLRSKPKVEAFNLLESKTLKIGNKIKNRLKLKDIISEVKPIQRTCDKNKPLFSPNCQI